MRRRLSLYLKWWRFLIWLAITSLSALVLCFVPLFDLLGYEFSLIMALVGSLATGHLAAAYPMRIREKQAPFPGARWTLLRLYGVCAGYGLALLLPPLLIISINALRIRNCDYSEGLGFFLFGSVASVLVAAGWGLAWGLVLTSRKSASIAWVLWWLGAIGLKLYDGWATPAVRSLGSYHGYFSGVLYDEAIALPTSLVTLRIRDGFEVAALLVLCAWLIDRSQLRLKLAARRGRRVLAFLTGALVFFAVVGYALAPTLGHRRSSEDVAEALGGQTSHGRCLVVHPAWMTEDEGERIARDCAFRLHQVETYLGVEYQGELTVYLFSDPEEKQALIGAGRTSVAKPWRREVYIQGNRFPHPVLKHEIVHVVAGEFGSGPLRVSGALGGVLASPGLIEGVAVAADWDEPELTPHQWSRAMVELDLVPSIDQVLGLSFLGLNSSRAYVLAGSFSRYLIDHYGAERYRRAYRMADPEAAYDSSLEELEREWRQFLEGVPLREGDLELARDRFVRPAVFEKVCAHEVAQVRERAQLEEARGAWEEALRSRLIIERFSSRDATSRLERARTLLGAGQHDRASTLLEQLSHEEEAPRQARLEAQELRADLLWSRGEQKRALDVYRRLLREPALESKQRMLSVKIAALTNTSAEGHLRRFLLDGERLSPEEPALAMLSLSELIADVPDFAIGHYLLGRQLFSRDEHERAIVYLERARSLDLDSETLMAENTRLLAISYFYLGQFGRARELFMSLADDQTRPLGARVLASDWVERCDWEAGQGERAE